MLITIQYNGSIVECTVTGTIETKECTEFVRIPFDKCSEIVKIAVLDAFRVIAKAYNRDKIYKR